jgi:sec-independent protein translocase protein TatA
MVGLENPLHIALVLIVVLLVFGAKRLPEMGKSLGEGLRGFKHAISGEQPDRTDSPFGPRQVDAPRELEPAAVIRTTHEDRTPTAF